MPSQNILILGAGELGMAITQSLAAQRHATNPPSPTLTVLLRPSTLASPTPASKAAQIHALRSMNVALLPGDLAASSPATLASLFRPFDTVIGCTGYDAAAASSSQQPLQTKICRAVLDAGVRRYFPWQFGVDYDAVGRGSAQDLFDEQLDVRDMLRAQATTKWTIVSTGMFTSFLFASWFGVVDRPAGVVRALGGWENRVTVTSAADIGRLVAEMVVRKGTGEEEESGVVFVAGDTVTYAQVADLVEGTVLGRGLRREVWTVEGLREALAREPGDAVRKYRVVFAAGRGVAWDVAGTWNARRGIEVQDVRSWVGEHLAETVSG